MIIKLKETKNYNEENRPFKKMIYLSALRKNIQNGKYIWVWGLVIVGIDRELNNSGYIFNGSREKALLEACSHAMSSITDYSIPIIVICPDHDIKEYLANCKYWRNNCGWKKNGQGNDPEIKIYMQCLAEITQDREIKYICPNNCESDKYMKLALRLAKRKSDVLKHEFCSVK